MFCICFSETAYHHLLHNLAKVTWRFNTLPFVLYFFSKQFLRNQGFLVGVSNENEVQVMIFHRPPVSYELLLYQILFASFYGDSHYLDPLFLLSLTSICSFNRLWSWQVWDLECRHLASNLQWESNITAFSVIYGTQYMYDIGKDFCFIVFSFGIIG